MSSSTDCLPSSTISASLRVVGFQIPARDLLQTKQLDQCVCDGDDALLQLDQELSLGLLVQLQRLRRQFKHPSRIDRVRKCQNVVGVD